MINQYIQIFVIYLNNFIYLKHFICILRTSHILRIIHFTSDCDSPFDPLISNWSLPIPGNAPPFEPKKPVDVLLDLLRDDY